MVDKATFLLVCTAEDQTKVKRFSEICRASFPVRFELGTSVFVVGSDENYIRQKVTEAFHADWPKAIVAIPWKFPAGFYQLEEEDKKIILGLQGEYLIERAKAHNSRIE